ncbi:MAG: hypothetical protein DRQ63_13320 [Gammaproteobacteria bacterium]|nr:MAG: hypothetical protein DRQ63_13320 [Gammaproteobacteria bacterium]
MLKRSFIAFITILAAGVVMAQAYKWVDDDGVVHYSDRPREGAVRIELPKSSTRRAQTPARTVSRQPAAAATDEAPAAFKYESLEISTPATEETLGNIETILNVALSVEPGLQTGHQIRVYFDGEPQMVSGTSFQLEGVYRGIHNLQAEIVDEKGKLMIRSRTNRFYVQQNAIGGG